MKEKSCDFVGLAIVTSLLQFFWLLQVRLLLFFSNLYCCCDFSSLRDCGVFVSAYAEILSEGQQVYSCGFDAGSQCAHYVSLLWHYGVTKATEGYTGDNDDPPRPRSIVLQIIDENAIVTLE